MDAQLKELIETIKSEGVESAEARAAEIIDSAQKRADDIVHAAKQEADEIRKNATAEANKTQRSSEAALEQAARDVVLDTRNRVVSIFEKVVEKSVSEEYRSETLADTIVQVVKSFVEKGSTDIAVAVSESELSSVESMVHDRLVEELKTGVSLTGSGRVSDGFRITEKDGSVYYDFTAEGVAEALSRYVTPKLQSTIAEAQKAE